MSREDDLQISTGSIIGNQYKVEAFLGEGGFGCVTKCYNNETKTCVAVKVNKYRPECFQQAKKEIGILKKLRCLDPDTCSIIRWNDFFFHNTSICLSFELLDQSLYDYMTQAGELLPMTEVKCILSQVNTALSHLHSLGIVHADLKTENVMVVDRRQKPLKVKLIDFGLAYQSNSEPGDYVQTIMYKAPEVFLGCPFKEEIDMWTLGHMAAELAVGFSLYPGNSCYEVFSFIVATQGQPPDHVLDQGCYTQEIFYHDRDGPQRWTFVTPWEHERATGLQYSDTRHFWLRSLDDLVELMDYNRGPHEDNHLLVDLIKRLMHLDPEERIKSQEVPQHPFLFEYLPQTSCNVVMADMSDIEERQQTSCIDVVADMSDIEERQQTSCTDVVTDVTDIEERQQTSGAYVNIDMSDIEERQQTSCTDVIIDMNEIVERQQTSCDQTAGPEVIHHSGSTVDPESTVNVGWLRRIVDSVRTIFNTLIFG